MHKTSQTRSVTVNIYGRDYQLACDPGQEENLCALADRLNECARRVSPNGRVPENLAIIMAALTLADDMAELERENERLKAELHAAIDGGAADLSARDTATRAEAERHFAKELEAIAARIEAIAANANPH